MNALIILSPILVGVAAVLGAWWLERVTKHTGLMFALMGIVGLLAGAVLLLMRPHFLPAVFVLQGIGFLVHYRSVRSSSRARTSTTSE